LLLDLWRAPRPVRLGEAPHGPIHENEDPAQASPEKEQTQEGPKGIGCHVAILDWIVMPQSVLRILETDPGKSQAQAEERTFHASPVKLAEPEHCTAEGDDVLDLVGVGVEGQQVMGLAGEMKENQHRQANQANGNPQRTRLRMVFRLRPRRWRAARTVRRRGEPYSFLTRTRSLSGTETAFAMAASRPVPVADRLRLEIVML
jgi:hypothetical protein